MTLAPAAPTLFTTNPDDFAGLEALVGIVVVTRPGAVREDAT